MDSIEQFKKSVNGVLIDCTSEEVEFFLSLRTNAEKEKAELERQSMSTYLTEVRELRERILNRLAGIATAALASDDQPTVDAFVLTRQRLLDITTISGAISATNLVELESAIKAEFMEIISSVPDSLKTAFDK